MTSFEITTPSVKEETNFHLYGKETEFQIVSIDVAKTALTFDFLFTGFFSDIQADQLR